MDYFGGCSVHLSTLPGQIENSELPSKYLLEAVVKLQNKVLDIKLTCVYTSEKNLILKTIVTQTKKMCLQANYLYCASCQEDTK